MGQPPTAEATGRTRELMRRLEKAEATINVLRSGQVGHAIARLRGTQGLLSQAQAALRESVERFRILFEKSPMPNLLYDVETLRFLAVNDAAVRIYGYAREEFLQMSVRDLRCPEDVEALLRFLPTALQSSASFSVAKHRKKDGTRIDVEVTGHTFPLDGRLQRLIIAQDVTERTRAEEALRKSEEQYRQIVEATADGIIKIDNAATIEFVNGRFAEMLGYEPREMLGMSVFAFMGDASRKIVVQSLSRLRYLDIALRRRDGTEVAVHIAGTVVVDGDGKAVGHLAVVRDITERKRLQSQLMVSDRMASVGTLAAGVAHEINNPLAVVTANLEYVVDHLRRMVGDDAGPAHPRQGEDWYQELRAPLEEAREAAERVRFVVRDLKIFSRSPTDDPRDAVDVKAILESSLRMTWNETRHRARLVKHYAAVPPVEANEARLGQVFVNLIVNAAQALPEGHAEDNEIRVSTRLEGERVVIEVSDTGPGIPAAIIGRIFDAFFTTKPIGVGAGIGLAICHRIVTDMGGEITVESELGKGSTFRVALPIATKALGEPAAPVVAAPATGRRGRILVVDDETMVLKSVYRILSKEHEVVTIAAAKEALAICVGGARFDLILCDLMMPDMTGIDLHRELALLAPEQADRMVFMTGGAFTVQAQRFVSETTREILEKPFYRANLRATVGRYVR